jgi:hypothetical protein
VLPDAHSPGPAARPDRLDDSCHRKEVLSTKKYTAPRKDAPLQRDRRPRQQYEIREAHNGTSRITDPIQIQSLRFGKPRMIQRALTLIPDSLCD